MDTGSGNFTGVVGAIYIIQNKTAEYTVQYGTIFHKNVIFGTRFTDFKVGMVQRGEVDMGGGLFSLMKERAVANSFQL